MLQNKNVKPVGNATGELWPAPYIENCLTVGYTECQLPMYGMPMGKTSQAVAFNRGLK